MTKFKTCTKCGIEKPIEEFSIRNSSKLDNRQARCKECNRSLCKEWRKDHDCNQSRGKDRSYKESQEPSVAPNKNSEGLDKGLPINEEYRSLLDVYSDTYLEYILLSNPEIPYT